MTSTASRQRQVDEPGGPPPRSGLRQALLIAAVLIAGLAIGLGISRLLARDGTAQSQPSVQSLDLPSAAPSTGGPDVVAPPPPAAGDRIPVEAATTPEAAVKGFLAAEVQLDFAGSYEFLSEADRVAYPTPASWEAAHGQFPVITGFAVSEVREATVITSTALRGGVDPVLGLVPGRATGTWAVVEEGGGWRVFFGSTESALAPLYPPDDGVAEAVRTWVGDRQECGDAAPTTGTLYGAPALAQELCDAPGDIVLGEPGVLQDGPDTAPLLAAFGPEVFTWARVVEVREPVAMLAVTAPVNDQWQVVGLLSAPPQ